MRHWETIFYGLVWGAFLLALAGLIWLMFDLERRKRRKLRNVPFEQVKIGQTFYDFGGEELTLREYLKTGETEAVCMSLKERPPVQFNKKDVVKIDVTFYYV